MDYFIFGIGFGASLVLLGWGLHQYGPGLRFRREDGNQEVLRAEEMILRQDWTRFCTALGILLLGSGVIMLLATVVTLLIRPSDRVGSIVAGTLFVLVLVGAAVWIGLFVSQHQGLGFRPESSMRRAVDRRRPAVTAEAPVHADAEPGSPDPDLEPAPQAEESPERHRGRTTGVQRHPRSRAPRLPRAANPSAVAADAESADREHAPEDGGDVVPVTAEHADERERHERWSALSRESRSTEGREDAPDDIPSRPSDARPESVNEPVVVEPEMPADAETDEDRDHGASGEDIVSSVTVRDDGRAPEGNPSPAPATDEPSAPVDDEETTHSSARMAPAHDLALANLRLRRVSRSVAKDS